MAINVGVNRAGYRMRLKYYGHVKFENDTAIRDDIKIKGIFYAKQVSGLKENSYITSTGINTNRKFMVLETPDNISGMNVNDFILYSGKKWIIVEIEESPDESFAVHGNKKHYITVRS